MATPNSCLGAYQSRNVVAKDAKGNLMVLGGNQGDTVNIKPFAVS